MEQPTPEELEELRFREALGELRRERGFSQGELARHMVAAGWTDFHQTTISRLEKGTRPIRLGEARALARVLGTDVSYMITWSEATKLLNRFWTDLNETERAYAQARDQVRHWEDARSSLRYSAHHIGEVDLSGILPRESLDYLDLARDRAHRLLQVDPASMIQDAIDLASEPPTFDENFDGEH